MNVIVACEESQVVMSAFRQLGHNAFSCDLQEPSGGYPEYHYQGDCFEVINNPSILGVASWDLMIAHPPCTFLSKAATRHLYNRDGSFNLDRYNKGVQAAQFFRSLYECDIPHICLENPVDFTCFGLPPYSQIISPSEFGHNVSKPTCLWLKNLPFLVPSSRGWDTSGNRDFYDRCGGNRQKARSKTFRGVAAAMAEQWSDLSRYPVQLSFFGDYIF